MLFFIFCEHKPKETGKGIIVAGVPSSVNVQRVYNIVTPRIIMEIQLQVPMNYEPPSKP